MLKKAYLQLLDFYEKAGSKSEDKKVLDFLKKMQACEKKSYIEIGAGLGRFVKIVSENFSFEICAVEINRQLAKRLGEMGIETYNINFMDNQFEDNQFDIVHCSHVIEHIPYPGVINFLDELIRITKPNGYVIIRSPLMSTDFYTSIDHIRPYPPKAILDYYSNPQQQIVGKYSISPIKIRMRRGPLLLNGYSYNPAIRCMNMFFKLSWACIRFPFSSPDGYVAIFKKIK
jgi:ubiquinone/menaquinone biosynthesis C-methylase UbiE